MFFGRRIMREARYQGDLIHKLRDLFPGCVVLKNDSGYLQGVPDLLVLYRNRWAMLEVKPSSKADHQINQDYYVGLFDDMSFASYIYPENEEEVLDALQSAFGSERAARLPQRQ